MIKVADYPQLKALCWNMPADAEVEEKDAARLYVRNWRHVRAKHLGDREIALMRHLKKNYRAAQLNV